MHVLTTHEWNLLKKRKRLAKQLRELFLDGNLMRGTVVDSRRRCGRSNCVCVREGKKHESRSLSINMDGKTVSVYLDEKREKLAQTATANYRKMWNLLNELTLVNVKLLSMNSQRRTKNK